MTIGTAIRRIFFYDPANIREDRLHALVKRQMFSIRHEIKNEMLPKMSRKDRVALANKRVEEGDDYFARLGCIEKTWYERLTPEQRKKVIEDVVRKDLETARKFQKLLDGEMEKFARNRDPDASS